MGQPVTTNRHVDAIARAYEVQARLEKVNRLIRVTPLGVDPEANADVIRMLEAATAEQRAKYAKDAGCRRPPSDETWRQFVEAMRARVMPANTNSRRSDPADAIT